MGSSQSSLAPTMYIELCPNENVVSKYFNHGQFHAGDSGLDLFVVEDERFLAGETKLVNMGVRCQAYTLKNDLWSRIVRLFKKKTPDTHKVYVGYWLLPRSSIYKTPLMMCNSVGVIDQGYTGHLCMPLRNVSQTTYTVKAGERLCQIVGPQHNPLEMDIVSNLRGTSRGTGGFGSTNNQMPPSNVGGTLTPKITVVKPNV